MTPEAPFEFLADEPAPRMLLEALKLYGTTEVVGEKHNATILGWADELGRYQSNLKWLDEWYDNDEIPWCGLFVGIVAARAGKPVQGDMMSARGWLDWGNPVDVPKLGDVLVFWRGKKDGTSGHVGLYVGEDDENYYVLGGNQSNQVNVAKLDKDRFLAARNLYKIGQPANCRVIQITADGPVSTNEA